MDSGEQCGLDLCRTRHRIWIRDGDNDRRGDERSCAHGNSNDRDASRDGFRGRRMQLFNLARFSIFPGFWWNRVDYGNSRDRVSVDRDE
jgi:hypothetical protein